MPGHDIIVIGGSAGGLESLRALIRGLPGSLPAALFVVLHISPDKPSLLPTLLNHGGQFLALHPADGTPIRNGCIYIAPPDHHMLIEGPIVRLVRGPRENRCRPAADPLFRSAAAAYGPRVVGVVLSGNLDDGTAGLMAIRRQGGVAMVQDPSEAAYGDMPQSALSAMRVDFCLPVVELAQRLILLAHAPIADTAASAAGAADSNMKRELDAMAMNIDQMSSDERPGTSSPYSCPDCGGVLWEMDDAGLLRFRCRVGHAFSVDAVLAGQSESLERALWVALKTLEERTSLLRRMITRANSSSNGHLAKRFADEFREAEEGAVAIRKALLRGEAPAPMRSIP
jgi:two-component system chemotaxis response regulator CheB